MAVNPGRLQAWFLACRPKTLSVSLSPVLVGTAVAWHDSGRILWLPLLAAAFGAAFIQIGTNLFNDVGDFLRGTDTPDRLGPERATAEGWLTPGKVKARRLAVLRARLPVRHLPRPAWRLADRRYRPRLAGRWLGLHRRAEADRLRSARRSLRFRLLRPGRRRRQLLPANADPDAGCAARRDAWSASMRQR